MTKRGKQQSVRRAAQIERRAQRGVSREPLPVWEDKVQGGPLVRQLQRHLDTLREESPHPNRQLFLDDVFIAYLLAFYNPTLRTLRTLEDFSQSRQAQKHLSIPRIAKSTLSDFHRIADPGRLEPLIAELRQTLVRKHRGTPLPPDLAMLVQQVVAVDGTFFSAAADVAWAVGHRNPTQIHYSARVDVQVDIHTWLPEVIAVPEPGESEAENAAKRITPGAIHLYDRGYNSFALLTAHYQADGQTPRAHFVLRAKKNNWKFVATEQRPLSVEAEAAQVSSDTIGYLPGSPGHVAPVAPLRVIVIALEDGDELHLITNLLDLPVETIALLYRYRWQVELFFRWLKCFANFDHLISHSRQGVLLNFYVIIIGVMLMYLHTGFRPSKYAFALLSVAAQGGSLDDILPILRERERQCEVARQGAARRRAAKKTT